MSARRAARRHAPPLPQHRRPVRRPLPLHHPRPQADADAVGECGPGGGLIGAQHLLQRGVEQGEPDRKHPRPHVPGLAVGQHRAAVVAALMQDGVAPEGGDLRLMRGPVGDMHGEDRAKAGMGADGGIEGGDLGRDLVGGDVEAGGQGAGHGRSMRAGAARGKARGRRTPLPRGGPCL